MRTLALVLALVLSSVGLAPVGAQQGDTTPFTTGITDAASLRRVVEGRLARARKIGRAHV